MLDEELLREIFKCQIFSKDFVVIEGLQKDKKFILNLIENNNIVFLSCKAVYEAFREYDEDFSGDEEFRRTSVAPLLWFKIPERFQNSGIDIENKRFYIGTGKKIILKGEYYKIFKEEGLFYNCIVAEPYKEDRENMILFYSHTKGDYRGLSNFYPSEIEIDGKVYQTVEHYYQASKAREEEDHERVRLTENPLKAKKLGRAIERRNDWEDVKLHIMEKACYAKFIQNKSLKKLLLSTKDLPIHEYNLNDLEWGWFDHKGEDKLGRVIMEVREQIKKEKNKF